jgi:hypothetical protein
MKHFIFFLIQAPDGLCNLEIKHLSLLSPSLITAEFLIQLKTAANSEFEDDEEESKSNDPVPSIRKCLCDLFSILQVNEIQDKKFKIHPINRTALTFLLQQQTDKLQAGFVFYESLCIEFFALYAVKLLRKITQQKRNGEVDHTIVSMHLQQGLWCLPDDIENTIDFNLEEIDLAVERFASIEGNFWSILEPARLIKFFDMDAEDNDFERQCIINLAIAVPSILIELDRVEDAINLIE